MDVFIVVRTVLAVRQKEVMFRGKYSGEFT